MNTETVLNNIIDALNRTSEDCDALRAQLSRSTDAEGLLRSELAAGTTREQNLNACIDSLRNIIHESGKESSVGALRNEEHRTKLQGETILKLQREIKETAECRDDWKEAHRRLVVLRGQQNRGTIDVLRREVLTVNGKNDKLRARVEELEDAFIPQSFNQAMGINAEPTPTEEIKCCISVVGGLCTLESDHLGECVPETKKTTISCTREADGSVHASFNDVMDAYEAVDERNRNEIERVARALDWLSGGDQGHSLSVNDGSCGQYRSRSEIQQSIRDLAKDLRKTQ